MGEKTVDEPAETKLDEEKPRKIGHREETDTPVVQTISCGSIGLDAPESRVVASQVSHRAVNTVIVVLTLIDMMIGVRYPLGAVASVAALGIALLTAGLWYYEQRLLLLRLGVVENALAKKNRFEFESIYIQYKFESSSKTTEFWALRLEPLIWLAAIAVNTLVIVIMQSLLR